jgi:hypothetical protein
MSDPFNYYGYPNFLSGGGGGSSVSIVAGAGLTSTTVGSTQTISASGPFLLWYSEPTIPNSRAIAAGDNVTLFNNGTTVTINAAATGGGAPTVASYLLVTANGTLSNARLIDVGAGLDFNDRGAGNSYTIGLDTSVTGASLLVYATGDTLFTGKKLLKAGTNVTLVETSTSIQINASGGGGGVTSVAFDTGSPSIFDVSGSPITSSGTITLSLDNQTAATFLGGPVSGAAATPTFRALASSDIPIIPSSKVTGLTNGTVTSVDLSTPAIFSVSGNPVTTSGTLAIALVAQGSSRVWAGPTSGADANPTFRALVEADIPQLSLSKVTNAAPADSAYVTVGAESGLSNERSLQVAGGLTKQDTGTTLLLSSSALQPLDATLTALAAFNTNGFVIQTAPDTFVGRGLSVAGGLTMQDNGTNLVISASGVSGGGGGTVTSVSAGSLSPLFTSNVADPTGAAAITFAQVNQASSLVFAGPQSGADAAPTFRALASSDIPTIPASKVSGLTNGTVTSVAVSMSDTSVFDVSGSPITGSGTITISLDQQASGIVLAGPSSGANASPTFRALVANDIPNLSTSKLTSGTLPIARGGTETTTAPTNGQVLIGNAGGTYTVANITAGSGVQVTNGNGTITIASSGAQGGTVTSVAQSVPASIMSVSGSPVTTSGTLAISLVNQSSGLVWAGPSSGAAATPTFRALVEGDIPTLSLSKVTNAASNQEAYVTLGTTSGLSSERALTVAGGLTIQDNGAGSTVVVSASALQPLDATLTALAAYNTTAFMVQTAADTFAGRTLQTADSNNISITNPAGTAGDPSFNLGSNAYNFKTISVSGQSDVVAEQMADTVTFVGAGGLTITTNAGTDTITFTGGGGGGSLAYSALSANASAAVATVYGCNTASASMSLYLPSAPTAGQEIYIKHRVSGNTLTIVPYQGTIDGAATVTSATLYDAYHLIYDGSGWMII